MRRQRGRYVDGTASVIAAKSKLSAIATRACRSGSGSALPRFSARRRIPAQAVALKKYRGWIEPLSSTCDNEHTLASLGQAEILSVEDSPGGSARGSSNHTRVRPFAPWRDDGGILSNQGREEASEGVVGCAEHAGDVFPEDARSCPPRNKSNMVDCICKATKLQREVAAVIGQRLAQPRDGK